jgi:dephospho-CoA kinase
MLVIGLTGSIGMGKTTVAAMLRAAGVPTHNADTAVHRLLAPGGAAYAAVARKFPEAVKDGHIDRALLGTIVFGDTAALAGLEAILHPLVRARTRRFVRRYRRLGKPAIALDIPLLFEKNLTHTVDLILCVTAPYEVQRARVLARPGMSAEKFAAILARQTPDAEKRARSDIVIDTSGTLAQTFLRVQKIVKVLNQSYA